MNKEIIHLEMNYEDYDFMDHLYEVMVQNGLWAYFKKNYSDEDQELIDQTEIDNLSFLICGRDEAYGFGYDLFDYDYDDENKGICYDNDIDDKSKYIAEKTLLFETFLNELISQSKDLREMREKYEEVCIGHDTDNGSLHELLFDYLFETDWLNKVNGYDKIDDQQPEFRIFFDDSMDLYNHNAPGLIVDSNEGGGAWEGVFHDILVAKDKIEDLKLYFIKEAETIIKQYLKENS